MFKKRFLVYWFVAALMVISLGLVACGDTTPTVAPAAATSTASAKQTGAKLADDMEKLRQRLDTITSTLVVKDVKQAKVLVNEFDEAWDQVEDGVKDRSADYYKKIEDKIDGMMAAIVKTETPDIDKSKQAVKELSDTIIEFNKTLTGK